MSGTARRRPVSTRWKVFQLLDRLRRLGWGPLAGTPWKGARAVLAGLASRLNYLSGTGTTTIEQVAAAAGYGMRWTRQCLNDLEDMGLIEWRRGGVVYGRPTPSVFRLNKAMLVDLINAAEVTRSATTAAFAAATRARLASIRSVRLVRARRTAPVAHVHGVVERPAPRPAPFPPAHAAVAASPSSRGGARRASAPRPEHCAPTTVRVVDPRPPAPRAVPEDLAGLSGPALARATLAAITRSRRW